MVLPYFKKIRLSMLCVTGVYLKEVTLFFSSLHLNVSYLSVCSSSCLFACFTPHSSWSSFSTRKTLDSSCSHSDQVTCLHHLPWQEIAHNLLQFSVGTLGPISVWAQNGIWASVCFSGVKRWCMQDSAFWSSPCYAPCAFVYLYVPVAEDRRVTLSNRAKLGSNRCSKSRCSFRPREHGQ